MRREGQENLAAKDKGLISLFSIAPDDPTAELSSNFGGCSSISTVPKESPSLVKIIPFHVTLIHSYLEEKALLAKVLTYAQYSLLGLVIAGDRIFGMMNMNYPGWYLMIQDKKMVVGMVTWLVGNGVISSLTQSGAFEIFVNNRLIFSKLATN